MLFMAEQSNGEREKESWTNLYALREQKLRTFYETATPAVRGGILSFIEAIVNSSESAIAPPFSAVNPAAKSHKGKQRDYQYFAQLTDTSIEPLVKKLLANPDIQQIRAITGMRSPEDIANSLDIVFGSYRASLVHLCKNQVDKGYIMAKIAHWLLQNGYNFKENEK